MKLWVLTVTLLLISTPALAEVDRSERYIPDIMNTTATIVVYEDGGGFLDRIRGFVGGSDINKVLDEVESRWRDIETKLSVYDVNSEAYLLNDNGHIENASDDLINIINHSIYYYSLTSGTFDITVQPLLDLWGPPVNLWKESEEKQGDVINRTMELMGADRIVVEGKKVTIPEGMKVTFGGIAKGYAIDEAIRIMGEHGIENALIRLGGQEYCLGINPDRNSPWTVGLTNPDNTSESITTFAISDVSISTSGNYERYFSPDRETHHIIDPRTGFSATDCMSVTIIAERGIDADALSTSVFVLGPARGMALVESLDGVECLIIDSEREMHRSVGLGDHELS